MVRVKENVSSSISINIGVPQGSVLGPILFLIYFNSIFEIRLLGTCTGFADDLVLQYSNIDIKTITRTIQCDLFKFNDWLSCMSNKSKIMYFNLKGIFFHPIPYFITITL